MSDDKRPREHHTIGHVFKGGWPNGLWLCTRWERRIGYFMKLLEDVEDLKAGHEKDVSERAIGATYHYVHPGEKGYRNPAEYKHEEKCECSICKPREKT